jgi:transcription-repair coupling factor (superfamily II helicase)
MCLLHRTKRRPLIILNDLQHLLGEKEVLYFPMSYKKPYEYDEIENANILMRSEVLNVINNHPEGNVIVTYPEAISEKVINKKSLATIHVSNQERRNISIVLSSKSFCIVTISKKPISFLRRVSLLFAEASLMCFPLRMSCRIALSCLAKRWIASAASILGHSFP